MNNFIFQNPVKLIFGRGMVSKIKSQIPEGKRVLVTFGGGSVKKNGIYDQVIAALEGREYIEFWGIEPNPRVDTLRDAVKKGREFGAEWVLAVGGGSVADGTKLISVAIATDKDPWQIVLDGDTQNRIPMGVVMTLPATGSEMNGNGVISNHATKEKYPIYGVYPEFSILDPQATFTLPKYQIACGLADTFVHVMEQYVTASGESMLMDRWSEGILSTLIELAPKIEKDQTNYDTMANFMLSSTMALNGIISMGVTEDWATHLIGHEITALTNLTHGHTLVVVMPSLLNVLRMYKGDKIVQLGERVFGIKKSSKEESIDATIKAVENFFRSLGLKTRLSENNIGEDVIVEIVKRFQERGTTLGEHNIDYKTVEKILNGAK